MAGKAAAAAECTRGRDALSPQNTKSRAALTSDCPSHNGQTIHRLLEGGKRQTSARTDPCESLLRTGPVLVHTPSKKCDYKEPTRRYVSRDPNECPAILFFCNEGETAFFNECGCGCVTNP